MMNIRTHRLLAATLSVAFMLIAKAQDPLPVPVMPISNFAPPANPDSVIQGSTGENVAEVATVPWEEQIRTRLDSFAAEANRAPYHVGISVFDLTDDIPVWGYNAHKVMRPASTQKVLTAITALSTLGSKHEFKTRSYYTGTIASDGTLQGDLYVVGDFDPMYSHADLKELARAIRDLGVKRISGKIFGDASMKHADLYGNGWCWDDVPSKYEPYLCALMVERGRVYPNFGSYSKDASFHPAAHFAYALSQELKNLGITGVSPAVVPYGTKDYPGGGQNFHTKVRTLEEVMQRMQEFRQPPCRGSLLQDCQCSSRQTSLMERRSQTSGKPPSPCRSRCQQQHRGGRRQWCVTLQLQHPRSTGRHAPLCLPQRLHPARLLCLTPHCRR